MASQPGTFITFEGREGVGKSTQASLLAQRLKEEGRKVILTREPGGSHGAEALREVLLSGRHEFSLRAEIMIHFAARHDHLDKVILPALSDGYIVISDRFTDSSIAYQGYGLGNRDLEILGFINTLVAQIPVRPHLTLILHASQAVTQQRLLSRQQKMDYYERLPDAFFERVEEGFRAIASAEAQRCVEIESGGQVSEVQERVYKEVFSRLMVE